MDGQTRFTQVVKRNGDLANFKTEKIEQAIFKAMRAAGAPDRQAARELTGRVLERLAGEQTATPHVERIQDAVEEVIYRYGSFELLKTYMLYRKKHEEIRQSKELFTNLDVIDDYLGLEDWRVKESANSSYSLQGLNQHISTSITSQYWLGKLYAQEIADAHRSGALHIHDLGFLSVYCVGWDLRDLLLVGFRGVEGKAQSAPARHLRTALGQIVNFFYTMQGEAAGAQAFANFDTFLAPYVRYDGLDYDQVKQCMQEFLFNLNVPTRVGFQTPFTNITMDLVCPDFLKGERIVHAGEVKEALYGDFQPEMDLINRAFAEVMCAGDAAGSLFSFPIPTYNITPDFDWENPQYEGIWRMTAKYGIPYFSNFVNSDMKPDDVRSMCCRLRLYKRELMKRGGGLFASNPLTGSVGVVTINLPRLGYEADSESCFFQRLRHLMELARESLETKRKVIEGYTERGLYPYSRFYLRHIRERWGCYWKNHFSTIGINGMNECCLNFLGVSIATDEGSAFAERVMRFMRDVRVPGADGQHLQPGGHTGREYGLPLCHARHQTLSGHHHRQSAGASGAECQTLLYQFHPPAGGLLGRHLRGAPASGSAPDPLHGRHGAAHLHRRARNVGRRRQAPHPQGDRDLPAALCHAVALVQHLPRARLPVGRALHLSPMRGPVGGVQPHRRLRAPREPVERR